jgi:hypothetical protein
MGLYSALLLLCGLAAAHALLPRRRLSFIASTNGGSSSFQPLADTLLEHASSWNVASAYCSSPGEITNETVLPEPPFCYNNWTLPIRAAAPHIIHIPIIQMLGNSGPLNFPHPYIVAEKYTAWAVKYNFSGYLLDAEFKGDDGAFATFLTVFADALHAVNKTLGVFLYPDLGKKDVVNKTTADYCAWGEREAQARAPPPPPSLTPAHAPLLSIHTRTRTHARTHNHPATPQGWARGRTSAAPFPALSGPATPTGGGAA